MKWIRVAIGGVVAITVIPTIVAVVNGLTGTGGDLNGTPAGQLLDLAPLVFVGGILGYFLVQTATKGSKND